MSTHVGTPLKMTLPAIPPLCGDSPSLPLRGPSLRRKQQCLSAAWPTDQSAKCERRRAICSWSVGYGTLSEHDERPSSKVADSAGLLDSRGTLPIPHAPARKAAALMPGLKSLVSRRRNSGEPSAPLVATLRKCETVLALTGSSSSNDSLEPMRPVNRMRSNSRLCSRCSSVLTLASSSCYSLNARTGEFVQVVAEDATPTMLLCKLCLEEVPSKDAHSIQQCNCSFCKKCMASYVEFEIAEGAYDISCPDPQCQPEGLLQQEEIRRLAGDDLFEKHLKYRLNREVEVDKNRMWCPRAGCETVCNLCPSSRCQPQSVHCTGCTADFCSNCRQDWHAGLTCDEYKKQLAKEGKVEETGIPFDSDLIKCCPMCNVPIEKDEGCAQMMCKRCKHVFCWYCLASLDDDFLLRHYDKGPCKNKLGHSRASVIWHRTQVIGIFAGFGILLLVASPLLLLAAPCIVCCKCRVCNAGAASKLDNEEELPDENP